MGHEFTSFILALLQVSGRPPKVDEDTIERIKKIDKPIDLETYVSLTCHNCPDVVQAFNIMAVLNPNITHTMIEGGMYQDEVCLLYTSSSRSGGITLSTLSTKNSNYYSRALLGFFFYPIFTERLTLS